MGLAGRQSTQPLVNDGLGTAFFHCRTFTFRPLPVYTVSRKVRNLPKLLYISNRYLLTNLQFFVAQSSSPVHLGGFRSSSTATNFSGSSDQRHVSCPAKFKFHRKLLTVHFREGGCGDSLGTFSVVAGIWSSMYSLGEVIGPSIGGVLLQHYGFPIASTVMATITIALVIRHFEEKTPLTSIVFANHFLFLGDTDVYLFLSKIPRCKKRFV